MDWYFQVLMKYAVFEGRATRSEFWWFTLFDILVAIAVLIAEVIVAGSGLLTLVYAAVTVIPRLAVSVRRLHDTDRSGWWLLVGLIPLGGLLLLIFYLMGSTPGPNRFGPQPGQPMRSAAAIASSTLEEDLNELYALYKSGALSSDEYQERRRVMLARRRVTG